VQSDCDVYDRFNCLFDEAHTVVVRFSGLKMDESELVRAEFMRAKNEAFTHMIREYPFIVDAVQLLLDVQIRSLNDTTRIRAQISYLVSLVDDKSRFFRKYKELLCYRMLDNCVKYYDSDRVVVEALSSHTELQEVHKVLGDADISVQISRSLNTSKVFASAVKPEIARVVVLLIGESMVLRNNSLWVVPSRGLDELLERKKSMTVLPK
jgi:hypothetical protein